MRPRTRLSSIAIGTHDASVFISACTVRQLLTGVRVAEAKQTKLMFHDDRIGDDDVILR